MTTDAGRLRGVRDHLGKLAGGLMALGATGLLGYLITATTQKPPSPHHPWPLWPYYLCGALLLVGALLYGEVHLMLPWQKYRALKKRAAKAESDLRDVRADLEKAQRERDDARRELEDAQRAAITAKSEPPPFQLHLYARPLPESGGWVTANILGVTDPTGQPERQVRIYLDDMAPYPRNIPAPEYRPVLRYTVPPQAGGNPDAGVAIKPGHEELWTIGYTGKDSNGIMKAGGFTQHRWQGLPWDFDPDERWRLSYRIECAGMPDVTFSIVVDSPDAKTIGLHLEG